MSWAMKVTLDLYWMMASTTEMAMKTTIRPRMMRIWRFSSISLMKWSFRKSRVRVELEASTREDRVDMEAESTRMTTTAMSSIGQSGEHGGDDGVISVGRHVDLVGEEPPEAAQEVAAAGHQQGEYA